MYLQYGSYRHDPGEVSIAIVADTEESEEGVPILTRERWSITGELFADTPTELTAKINALQNAYRMPGRDVGLFEDSGLATAHRLTSTGTLGGVRIRQRPSFPEGGGAEYTNRRSYTIVLEAEIPATPDTNLLQLTESLTFIGGGPQYGWHQPILGRPIPEQIRQATTYTATQEGTAIGLLAYPPPKAPIWNDFRHHANVKQVTMRSPTRRRFSGGVWSYRYPISWSYKFESDSPMIGVPG